MIVFPCFETNCNHNHPISISRPVPPSQVSVFKGITLPSNHALVLFQEINNKVSRKIVHGPCVHIPVENEWIHRFVWHGALFSFFAFGAFYCALTPQDATNKPQRTESSAREQAVYNSSSFD
jgi:hypothetical protein